MNLIGKSWFQEQLCLMTLMHMKIPKSLNTKHSQDARHNKKTVECAGERERERVHHNVQN
jgi:hypothetical protein